MFVPIYIFIGNKLNFINNITFTTLLNNNCVLLNLKEDTLHIAGVSPHHDERKKDK